MKKLGLLFTLFLITVFTFAEGPLPKGKLQFNAGLGFSTWGIPVILGIDYGVHPDISVGLEASFRSYSYKWNNGRNEDSYRLNLLGLGGNANYHFNTILSIPKKWDFYAGINVGFFMALGTNNSSVGGLGWGGQVGGRYYFTDKIGINLEAGGGNFSGGKIGISIKL